MKRRLTFALAVLMMVIAFVVAVPSASAATLKTPSVTKIEALSKTVKLTWGKVSGAAKYRVFLHNGKQWTKLADTTATHYTFAKVKSGTSYKFTVRCVTKDGKKFTSNYNKTGWTQKFVTAPAISKIQNIEAGVQLTFNKPTGTSKIRVFRKTAGSGWKKLTDTTTTSYTDKTAMIGSSYNYTVRCVSSNGKVFESGYNTTGWSVTRRWLSTPSVTSLSVNSHGDIDIKWGKVADCPYYRVFYRSNGSGWKKIADVNGTAYTWNGAVRGTTYDITVRCIAEDKKTFISSFTSGLPITYLPSEVPTQPTTTSPAPTPTETITPTVHVYDGKISVSWNAVAGATKYVVKTYFASQGISNPFDTKTVTTTSTTMNHVFTQREGYDYNNETFLTAVIAYKNNTAITTAKPVSTTTVGKFISSRGNERIRTIFTVERDINFCNTCGKWMKNAYQTNLMGKISPDEACMGHQPYHRDTDGCGAWSYRCWKVQWPSGLMNYEQSDNANYHKYWSIVDTKWTYNYYPTVTTAPSISSIQKVSYTKEIHPQQLDNQIAVSDRTDSAPLMQADGALEITFKPVDNNIKIYDIWVKTTDAKSVNKLTQIPAEGDRLNNIPMYNAFDGRWTYDEKYNDWAVIGYILVTDKGYESYCYFTDTRTSSFRNKTVTTSNLSTLVYTLPNWYGNEYNSCYDWNMLDNNTKYEFAIQPRLDRRANDESAIAYGTANSVYSDTVPAAPRGQSKSYTWTGRDYEYYTENNAYFQGASIRNTNIKSKTLELYAEQRNLNWKTWGNFELFQIGHDDRTGKDYIKDTVNMALVNGYRIPARTNFQHNGGNYEWKGYNQNGNYALSTRNAVINHSSTHHEGNTVNVTIVSNGVYARTSMYDIWTKRNDYGKHITLIDHSIPYYDPLCYEYTIDGGYRYYYEDISDAWVKQRPAGYVACTPDTKAARKNTNEHLYESEIAGK